MQQQAVVVHARQALCGVAALTLLGGPGVPLLATLQVEQAWLGCSSMEQRGERGAQQCLWPALERYHCQGMQRYAACSSSAHMWCYPQRVPACTARTFPASRRCWDCAGVSIQRWLQGGGGGARAFIAGDKLPTHPFSGLMRSAAASKSSYGGAARNSGRLLLLRYCCARLKGNNMH